MNACVDIGFNGRYIVKALFPDRANNHHTWEIVDSTWYQYKAKELMFFLRDNEFTKVSDVYKTEYYQNWINIRERRR